jgi:hypothetical protein
MLSNNFKVRAFALSVALNAAILLGIFDAANAENWNERSGRIAQTTCSRSEQWCANNRSQRVFGPADFCAANAALTCDEKGGMKGKEKVSGPVLTPFLLDFNALILTHGVLELTAICIAGGSGLLLAKAIIAPGNRTRREALKSVSGDAFKLLAGCMAMLVVAGIIEAFVTPHFSQTVRWSVAATSAIFLVVYFGLVGRGK